MTCEIPFQPIPVVEIFDIKLALRREKLGTRLKRRDGSTDVIPFLVSGRPPLKFSVPEGILKV